MEASSNARVPVRAIELERTLATQTNPVGAIVKVMMDVRVAGFVPDYPSWKTPLDLTAQGVLAGFWLYLFAAQYKGVERSVGMVAGADSDDKARADDMRRSRDFFRRQVDPWFRTVSATMSAWMSREISSDAGAVAMAAKMQDVIDAMAGAANKDSADAARTISDNRAQIRDLEDRLATATLSEPRSVRDVAAGALPDDAFVLAMMSATCEDDGAIAEPAPALPLAPVDVALLLPGEALVAAMMAAAACPTSPQDNTFFAPSDSADRVRAKAEAEIAKAQAETREAKDALAAAELRAKKEIDAAKANAAAKEKLAEQEINAAKTALGREKADLQRQLDDAMAARKTAEAALGDCKRDAAAATGPGIAHLLPSEALVLAIGA